MFFEKTSLTQLRMNKNTKNKYVFFVVVLKNNL